MPAIGTLRPSSMTTTPPIPTSNPSASANKNNALTKLCQALLQGTRWLFPRSLSTYLVAVMVIVIFGTVLCAMVSAERRRRRCHASDIAAERYDDAKRLGWRHVVDEKEWQRREEELRQEREELERREEGRPWWQDQEERKSQRQQEQQQRPYEHPQRRWSDFTPSSSFIHPIPPPLNHPFPSLPRPPFAPLADPSAPLNSCLHLTTTPPHLLAAILPQPTIHSYQRPQHPQSDDARLTRQWDEKRERVVGAVMAKGGFRRHVRVFGG